MAAPWTFVERYPALALSLFESIRFSQHAFEDRNGELFFTGTLLLDGPLAAIAQFLNGSAQVPVSGGPIEEIGDAPATVPKMLLVADALGKVTLGSFELSITLEIADEVILNAKDKPIAAPAMRLVASIPITGHDPLRIVAAVGANLGHVIFTAEIPAGLELGLPLLNRLAGNTPVATLLPTQLPLVSDLILTGWSIGVAPKVPSLTSVSVAVETRESFIWEIVPGLLAVERIGFSIDVAFLPGASERYAELSGRIRLVEDPPVFLELGATFPNFVISGSFEGAEEPPDLSAIGGPPPAQLVGDAGCIDLRALAIKFIGPAAGDALPPTLNVCTLDFELDPKSVAFSLDAFLEVAWTVITINGKPLITLTGIQMMFRHLARETTGTIAASFRLADPVTGPEIGVSGSYGGAEAGWLFSGQLLSPQLSLRELIAFYMPDATLPPGDVVLSRLSASISTGPSEAYGFAITVVWKDIFGGALPLKSVGAAVMVDSQLVTGVRTTKGRIEGLLDFGGFTMTGGFSFDSGADNVIDLTVFGITAKINTKTPPFILTISPKGLSFGDVVALLVQAALGGRKVSLPSPWDVLNLISLDGLAFFINFTDEKIGFTLALDLNLGFINLKKIALTYSLQTKEVVFEIADGSFLGGAAPLPKPWDVTDPAKAPAVPGQGSDIFNLKFLAAGQHVLPASGDLPASVPQAVDILQAAFKVPARKPPLKDTALRFSNEAGWLIGSRSTIVGIIDLDTVFYDPLLYGIAIQVTGGNFENLRFEVLYKKVSDTVGVYQIDLTLPDFIRNQDFGTFSVTLPAIKLSIFTNGNFILDLGFPTNGDFGRAFSLQWLPFVGSGGFYYGQLSGETAKGLPVTACGDFNPAIAFGIGVRVGIGKDIDKGILKAGLSLTVQGILEGLIAVYHPYPGTPAATGSDPVTYYAVQGQIALVGRIYGEVNFAIISAELDITARIAVRLLLAAAKAILIAFEAGVTVSLRVTINLGLFKINIRLAFSATVRADFTIGSDDPNPPWLACAPSAAAPRRYLPTPLDRLAAPLAVADMQWVPIKPAAPVPLQLYYLPQFTVGEVEGSPRGQGVALLFIESADTAALARHETAAPKSFEALAEGLLLWTVNAFFKLADPTVENLLKQTVTADDLAQIFAFLTRTGGDGLPLQPFSAAEAIDFLAAYVAARLDVPALSDGSGTDPVAGVFPMLPIFSLCIGEDDIRDFATFGEVDDTYLSEVKRYFQALAARYRRESHQDAPNTLAGAANPTQSLVSFLFVDYLAMLIRALVEDARDLFGRTVVTTLLDTSLDELARAHPQAGLSAQEWGFINRHRPLRTGANLRIDGMRLTLHHGDTAASVAARLGLPEADLIHLPESAAAGQRVRLPAFIHRSPGGETLLQVANRFGLPVRELIAANSHGDALFAAGTRLLLRGAEAMTVAEILDQLNQAHRLQNLSGMAARVYLSGLRPPAPPATPTDPLGDPQPLYRLCGQQFDADGLVLGTPVTLGLTTGEAVDWLTFGPDFGPEPPPPADPPVKTDITFAATQAIVDLVSGLQTAGGAFNPQSTFTTFPLFDEQPRRVSLRNPIPWRRPDVAGEALDPGIWSFPPELVSLINARKNQDARFQLAREVDGIVTPVTPSWSTLIPITVRQAPSGESGAPVANTYELQGTDEAGGQLLEQLLIRVAGDPTLSAALQLLYPEEPIAPGDESIPVGLRSDGAADTSLFLLQTNLSTVANPVPAAADLAAAGSNLVGMTGIELLQRVWEGSVVRSGGYFLFYQVDSTQAGLPEYLFNETPVTTVFLLVTTNIGNSTTGDPLPPYLNAVVTSEPVAPEDELLFVRAVPTPVTGYRMGADETLAGIARAFRTDPGAIARANAYRRLRPGVRLNVPARTDGLMGAHSYEPLPDDTLATLAFYRGVSVTALAFANRDVPGLFAEPLSFDDRLQVKVPSLAPGNVGFALTRPNPDQTANPNQRQVEALYNWLSFRIAQSSVFPRTNPALPVGPATQNAPGPFDPDADTRPPLPRAGEPWTYEAVVPVFLDPGISSNSGLDTRNDPYATVGESVQLELAWLDMFGNTLPVATTTADWPLTDIAIRYTDDVIGVDAWPNVIARYAIAPVSPPELVLSLSFVRDRYLAGGAADPVQLARADRDQFQTVYFQIKQDDVRLTLETSLEAGQAPDASEIKTALLDWLVQIHTFLTAVIDQGPPVNPQPPLTLDIRRAVSASNPKNLFALSVVFAIARDPALVDDQFKDVPAVAGVQAVITPDIAQPAASPADEPLPPLRRFANDIETAFTQLRVLTGSRQADEDESVAVDIWLARFGDTPLPGIGFDIQADTPLFFAPSPLATRLLSRPDRDHQDPVPVYPYVSGEFIGDQTPTGQIVTGLDIESLARDFVVAVDAFLSAEFSVPAWRLAHEAPPARIAPGGRVSSLPGQPDPLTQPFESIIDAKANVAAAIADDAIAILKTPAPTPENLAEAREQWRQQLLLQLGNAYRIDTGVQYNVTVSADTPPADRLPPRLFGKVIASGQSTGDDRAFSFNASSIALDNRPGRAFLSTMLDVRQARAQRNLPVALDLQLTQIQRDIRNVPEIQGYQASAWLSFVNPFIVTGDAGPLLTPVIPIPLRAYPTPPSLTDQVAEAEVGQFTAARGEALAVFEDDLAKARAWRYAFTYEGVEADQDTVNAVVTVNVRQDAPNAFADADEPDLLEALVQFSTVYPDIARDLEAVRSGVDDPVSRNALASFAWLVQRVGNAWGAWREVTQSLAGLRDAPLRESAYRIREDGQGDDPLVIEVSRTRADGEPIELPVIVIQDYTAHAQASVDTVRYTYTDAAGSPLSAAVGKAIRRREAVFGGFDVLKQENAWAGVFVVRNEGLVADAETADDFLYQTPLIRFIDPVTPLLDPNIEIDIARFTPGGDQHALGVFLGNFFDAFFAGAVSVGESRTLAMGGSYEYRLGSPGLPVVLPIFLSTPQPFPIETVGTDNPFLQAVAGQVEGWLNDNAPAGRDSGGMLLLDLTVYASLADSKLPVLRLRRLTLATARLVLP